MVLRFSSMLIGVALCWAAATANATAQTAGAQAMQTVTGSGGYSYQVPGDWQKLPDYLQQRIGNQTLNIDGTVASTDGSEHAHVEAANGFGITSANLNDFMTTFFSSPGGPGTSGPATTVIDGPSPVQVTGADTAVQAAASYSDPDGTSRVIAARIALAGQTTYLLALDMSQDFYQSNANFGKIMGSFALSSGRAASAPSAPGSRCASSTGRGGHKTLPYVLSRAMTQRSILCAPLLITTPALR
jgi:hypothetical protein